MFTILKNLFLPKHQNELKAALAQGALLVDVRTPAEFAGGSVLGAINIPLNTIPQQLKLFKGKPAIVVFCRSGNRSQMAKNTLTLNGIVNVFNGGTWKNVQQLL